ncbi:MAG: hypothetical protein V4588_10435 [Pseudomonadota bacterium]
MNITSLLFKKKPVPVKKPAPLKRSAHQQYTPPPLIASTNFGIQVEEVEFDEFDRRRTLLGKNQSGSERRGR